MQEGSKVTWRKWGSILRVRLWSWMKLQTLFRKNQQKILGCFRENWRTKNSGENNNQPSNENIRRKASNQKYQTKTTKPKPPRAERHCDNSVYRGNSCRMSECWMNIVVLLSTYLPRQNVSHFFAVSVVRIWQHCLQQERKLWLCLDCNHVQNECPFAEIWSCSTKQKTVISQQGIQHHGTGNDSTDRIIPVLHTTPLLTIQQSNKEYLSIEEAVRWPSQSQPILWHGCRGCRDPVLFDKTKARD